MVGCCCCCCCPLRWTGKGLPKATAEFAIVGCDMMVKDDVVCRSSLSDRGDETISSSKKGESMNLESSSLIKESREMLVRLGGEETKGKAN